MLVQFAYTHNTKSRRSTLLREPLLPALKFTVGVYGDAAAAASDTQIAVVYESMRVLQSLLHQNNTGESEEKKGKRSA